MKYSRYSLTRTPKGPTKKFKIANVRYSERFLAYICYEGTEGIVRDKGKFEIAGVRDIERRPYWKTTFYFLFFFSRPIGQGFTVTFWLRMVLFDGVNFSPFHGMKNFNGVEQGDSTIDLLGDFSCFLCRFKFWNDNFNSDPSTYDSQRNQPNHSKALKII